MLVGRVVLVLASWPVWLLAGFFLGSRFVAALGYGIVACVGAVGDESRGWDFFVSYTREDQAWAEWIAWVIEEGGQRVLIQAWDFVPGSNWVAEMQTGARDAHRTVAVLSKAYLESVYGSAEWQAAWASDPNGTGRKLLVMRVAPCESPGLLAGVVRVDLFGVSEAVARARVRDMVTAVMTGRSKPWVAPMFPGEERAVPHQPGFPGGPLQTGNTLQGSPGVSSQGADLVEADRAAGSIMTGPLVDMIEVAIGRSKAPGRFRVQVVSSPAGEARSVVELDAAGLLARRTELEQTVLSLGTLDQSGMQPAEQHLREVGQELFAAMLGKGKVAECYRASAAVAAAGGHRFRVVVRIDDPVLAGLPWEAMYDDMAGRYLCRSDQLIRRLPVTPVAAPLAVDPPLRILGVASAPADLPPLDVNFERDQLQRALAEPASRGLVEVVWAPQAAWADLQDLLLSEQWHVLHYIGHSDYDSRRGEGVLALTGQDGRADLVGANRLVDLLGQASPMPQLVVLNSGAGAVAGVSDLFSSVAAALIRGGVSAVVAMQYMISDGAALAFARGFYSAIGHGRGVDEAVSSGRAAILGLSSQTLEWVTPVLYLRGHDSRLFTVASAAPPAGQGITPTGTALLSSMHPKPETHARDVGSDVH
jgi:hypothetical protein